MADTKNILETLIDVVLAGSPSAAVKALIKAGINEIEPGEKTWEDLYIDAFHAAVDEMEPRLARYASDDGEVGLDENALREAFQGDLSVHELAESDLRSPEFINKLADRLYELDAFTIGGNKLSSEDYRQLTDNLVKKHAPVQFKQVVEQNEVPFRQALRREALKTNTKLEDVQTYLEDHHVLIIDELSAIRADIADLPDALADVMEARATAGQPPPQPDSLFLSYAWDDDKPFAEKLHRDLTDAGLTVWRDEKNLPSRGNTLRKEIKKGIEQAARFVPVIGPVAVEKANTPGTNINLEWDYARSLCKAITPVLRKGESSLIPADFRQMLWFDFRDDAQYEIKFEELLARLREPAAPPGPLRGGPWPRLPVGALPRVELVVEIKDALRLDDSLPIEDSAQAGVVSVQAPGGLGKSTLATTVALDCDVRRSFPDGVVWVEVGREATAEALRIKIGVAFGASAEQIQQPGDLTALLFDKDCLIILDDAWKRAPVEQCIVPGENLRYLITTRTDYLLDLPDENGIRLGYLSDEEGAELIARRLGIVIPERDEEAEPDWPDRTNHLEIAHELSGHMQATAICAARLAAKDPASPVVLRDELRAGDSALLAALKRDLDDESREGNFLRSFALSYEALPEDMQRRFRLLGVLVEGGSLSAEAAQVLWEEENARRGLRYLVQRALLEEAEQDRYTLHTLIHTAVRALLVEAGEHEAAFNRYAEFVIVLAQGFNTLPPEEWSVLEPDLPHVDYVGDALAGRYKAHPDDANGQDKAARFARTVTRYVYRRRQVVQTVEGITLRGLNWLEMGLAVAREAGEQEIEALFLNEIGLAWDALGDKRKALEYFEQALVVRQAVGDAIGEATTLNNIGGVWDALGEKRKALETYEQALPLRRAVGDRGGEATTLNNIGAVWSGLGEKRKALETYEQVLPVFQAVGDRGGEAATLNNIGRAWDALGEKRKALETYELALKLRRAVEDRNGEAATLNNIGMVWNALGEKHKALEYYEQALLLYQKVEDRGGEAATLNNIGLTWGDLGRKHKALEFFERALALARAIGERNGEAVALNNIGLMWKALGGEHKALEYYDQALVLRQAVEDRAGEAVTLNNIGVAWEALGKKRKALEYYEQALPLRRAVGDRGGEATTLNNIAYIHYQNGEFAQAADRFREVIKIFRDIGAVSSEAAVLANLAMVQRQLGNVGESIRLVENAIALLRQYDLPQDAGGGTLAQREALLDQLRGELLE